MGTPAARSVDTVDFYGASLEDTRLVNATVSGDQTTDGDGPLTPGKYLVQVFNISDSAALIWILVGPFVPSSPISLAASPGARRIPLSAQALVAMEFNVIAGINDRLGAITTVGTAEVYLTHMSRIH